MSPYRVPKRHIAGPLLNVVLTLSEEAYEGPRGRRAQSVEGHFHPGLCTSPLGRDKPFPLVLPPAGPALPKVTRTFLSINGAPSHPRVRGAQSLGPSQTNGLRWLLLGGRGPAGVETDPHPGPESQPGCFSSSDLPLRVGSSSSCYH